MATRTFVEIDSGAATVALAAASGTKRHVLIGYSIVGTGAGTVEFRSNTTPLTGEMVTASGVQLKDNLSSGLMETVAGEALNLTIATAGVDGYAIVDTFDN